MADTILIPGILPQEAPIFGMHARALVAAGTIAAAGNREVSGVINQGFAGLYLGVYRSNTLTTTGTINLYADLSVPTASNRVLVCALTIPTGTGWSLFVIHPAIAAVTGSIAAFSSTYLPAVFSLDYRAPVGEALTNFASSVHFLK